jgi:hypothetical protein
MTIPVTDVILVDINMPCYVGPCHHGMAHPQIMVGGDSLQIWKVAVNVLNKQLQTAYKGAPPAWGWGEGLTDLHHKTPIFYLIFKTRTNSLDK